MKSTLASMSKEQVLKIALTAGKILLVSGAETYRVEDTMLRICHEGGMHTIASFCTPSLIMIGEETMEGASLMYRVTERGTDLTLISEVNSMSFQMPHWNKSFQDTMALLTEKTMRKPRPAREDIFWSGLAGGFFGRGTGGRRAGIRGCVPGLPAVHGFCEGPFAFPPQQLLGHHHGRGHHLPDRSAVPESVPGSGHGTGYSRGRHALAARNGFHQRHP